MMEKVKIGGMDIALDMEGLKFDETNALQRIQSCSAKYAWFGIAAAKAKLAYQTEKIRRDILYAELDAKTREVLIEGGEKFTEKVVESFVRQHADMQDCEKAVLELDYIADAVKTMRDAYMLQKDLLIEFNRSQSIEINKERKNKK